MKLRYNDAPVRDECLIDYQFKHAQYLGPRMATECEVFSVRRIFRAINATDQGGQLHLFNPDEDNLDPTTALSNLTTTQEDAIKNELDTRTRACADGTCPFIGEVAAGMCFRRPDNPHSKNPALYQ